jgi:lactoylglutathione lyase
MRLNHLNLTVPDVAQTREFFEKYFDFRCVFKRTPETLSVLVDEGGFIFTLSNFDHATEVKYPGAFHIGFGQDSRERVDEIHRRLTGDGVDASNPKEFHGAWTFYFRAPGDFIVEVFHQPMGDQAG